jgi:gliding motility-associated-like protein
MTVTVEIPTKGIRYPTQDLIINRPSPLNARTFGKSYLWSPDIQLNSPRLISPTITPVKQQQYTVVITTNAGCVTVDTVLVRVFPNINIYVPDGFSPDGDGRNDKLYPIPIGIREIRMFRIYNRWGTLVYDNKNASVNTGWDGTYLRTAQPMESYVWVAEGIDNDGKFIRRSGNTILIR